MSLPDAVKIALFIDSGTVVLQHRDKDAPTNADKLTFFGGSIEKEDADALFAAERELREETDLVFARDSLVRVASYPRKNGGSMHLFRLEIENERFAVREGQGAVAMRLADAAMCPDVTAGTKEAINYLRNDKEQ